MPANIAEEIQGARVQNHSEISSAAEVFSIIDIFAGVGGLSLGAARAGFRLAAAIENDPHAMKAHRVNFPNSIHIECDVNDLSGPGLLASAKVEKDATFGIIGGPPCQGFSTIGRREAKDSRNNLFGKFFSLVAEAKPTFFVAENVLGILDDQYDGIRERAFSLVRNDYTMMDPLRLQASDFGAPTSRKRVFFIGIRKGVGRIPTIDDFETRKVTVKTLVRDALFGLPVVRRDWQSE